MTGRKDAPSFDDQTKAAFTGASDCCKQLITLATGLLALEITFVKDIAKGLDPDGRQLLGTSWLLFLASVVFGMWAMLALTGSLGSGRRLAKRSIFEVNVRLPAAIQVLFFLAGLLYTVRFGFWALSRP